MKGLVTLAALLVATALCAPGALAQSVSAWDLVHPGGFEWQIRSHRLRVAADLVSRVRVLAAIVPEQSDEKRRELQEAEAAIKALGDAATPRQRSRLYLSRAYQHRRLLDLLADTLQALDCVRTEEAITGEMYCWARASSLLMDEETMEIALNVLRDSRLIPRDEDIPVQAQDPVIWYGEYGRGIVSHIIAPFLRSLSGAPARADASDGG